MDSKTLTFTADEATQRSFEQDDPENLNGPRIRRLYPKNMPLDKKIPGKIPYCQLLLEKLSAASGTDVTFGIKEGFRPNVRRGNSACHIICAHGNRMTVTYNVDRHIIGHPLEFKWKISCPRCYMLQNNVQQAQQENLVVEQPLIAPPIQVPQEVNAELNNFFESAVRSLNLIVRDIRNECANSDDPMNYAYMQRVTFGDRLNHAWMASFDEYGANLANHEQNQQEMQQFQAEVEEVEAQRAREIDQIADHPIHPQQNISSRGRANIQRAANARAAYNRVENTRIMSSVNAGTVTTRRRNKRRLN